MVKIAVVFDNRPCDEEPRLGHRIPPLCNCRCTTSFHRIGDSTIAYKRQPRDGFAAPCLTVARDCKMLCFIGTGVISVPPPLLDFAAEVGIPLRVIADIGVDPRSRLARWMPDVLVYRINFRLAELRRLVATGETITATRDTLAEFAQYWDDIRWVDEGDGTIRINLASACMVGNKLPQDDADKLAVDDGEAELPALDEDRYSQYAQNLWRDERVPLDFQLSDRERELIRSVINIDRLAPAEFIELMSSPYTFGWQFSKINESGRIHPWSNNLLAKMDEINTKNGIDKYTDQYLVFPGDNHMRNNPIIDALLRSRRYGLMVFACLMSVGELLARDDIREYVCDTFREWDRANLVANFNYLLADKCRLTHGILIHHRKSKEHNEYLTRGGNSMGHFMFADIVALAATEVTSAMAVIDLAVPPRK